MLSAEYLHKIERLNPGKIYVENIRSIFGVSRVDARTWCEMAVSAHLFERRIGLVCPNQSCNGRIIADFNSYNSIPDEISCSTCEVEGNETSTYKTANLSKVEFYKLREV